MGRGIAGRAIECGRRTNRRNDDLRSEDGLRSDDDESGKGKRSHTREGEEERENSEGYYISSTLNWESGHRQYSRRKTRPSLTSRPRPPPQEKIHVLWVGAR
mmetsp:Transcript_11632/g.25499  ORF Transcript_11632/g.25499 Transcript_11632/m.25499 type:complete len:102 (-) Transcript_11632:240-545(-)